VIALGGWIAALAVGVWVFRLRSVLGWRTELAARACHELRGPITVARLGLESATRDTELRAEALKGIDLELQSAGVALEDLGAAFAGLRGPWRVDAVDAPALLAESFEALRPLALARGVDLGLHWRGERAIIPADRVRLAQATGNLIANAIEHGAGRVELHGRAGDHGLEIEVTDAGHGLPSPVTDLIARPRAGRGRRGRGLAIAADVAERHGGRLVARTGEDGSRLMLTIPLRREGER
jgi:signal transduction histidine kinase